MDLFIITFPESEARIRRWAGFAWDRHCAYLVPACFSLHHTVSSELISAVMLNKDRSQDIEG